MVGQRVTGLSIIPMLVEMKIATAREYIKGAFAQLLVGSIPAHPPCMSAPHLKIQRIISSLDLSIFRVISHPTGSFADGRMEEPLCQSRKRKPRETRFTFVRLTRLRTMLLVLSVSSMRHQ